MIHNSDENDSNNFKKVFKTNKMVMFWSILLWVEDSGAKQG